MAIRFLSAETIDGNLIVEPASGDAKLWLVSSASDIGSIMWNHSASGTPDGSVNYDADSGGHEYWIGFGGNNDKILGIVTLAHTVYNNLVVSDSRIGIDGNATIAGNITLGATKTLKYTDDKIKIGGTSNTPGAQGIQIGSAADSSGAQGIGMGYAANATGNQSIAMGYNPTASGTYSQAFGYNVSATGSGTVVFGTSGSHSDADTFVLSGIVLKVTGTGASTFSGNVTLDPVANSDVTLKLHSNSGALSDAYAWNLIAESSGDNYEFSIAQGTTDVLKFNNTAAAGNNNATFAGTVTATQFIGVIAGTTASFVSTVAGATVVSSEGAYSASGSVILYEAKRSGGAVGGDWSYDDTTTDMSLGTNTNHSFALKTNNTRRLTIDNSGNVGIGTTSPESLLAVKGGTAVSDLFSISDNVVPTSGVEYGVMMIKTASIEYALNVTAYGLTSKGLRVYNNGALADRTAFEVVNAAGTNFVVDGLGNVGIGTTVPAFELQVGGTDVSGTGSFSAQFAVLSEATTGYPSGFIFKAPRVTTSSNRVLVNEDFGTYFSSQVYATSTAGAQSDIPIVFAPLGGNVGIGTTSPVAKLDILGDTLNIGGDNGSWTARTNSTTKVGHITAPHYTNAEEDIMGMIMIGTSTANELDIGGGTSSYNAATDILFYTAANNTTVTGTARMIIKGSGNIGIGTTSPTYALDVVSSAVNNSARFRNSAGGDTLVRIIAGDYNTEIDARLFLGEDDTHGITFEYDGSANMGYIGMNNNVDPTGAYSKRIQMSRGGTEVAFMAGNVGIGEASPDSKLHVKGDMVTIEDPSGGFKMELSADANPVTIMSDNLTGAAYGEMAFIAGNGSGANDQTRMLINSSGNVGIGTTSPTNGKLEVQETATTAALWVQTGGTTDAYTIADFRTGTNASALAIKGDGNVGIGTPTPGGKLDVNGPVVISPNTAGKDTFTLSTNASNDARLLMKSDTTTKVDIQANGDTYFNGGNVGIGISSPVARVDAKSTYDYNVTDNGVKAGRVQYSWYTGQDFANTDAYVHIKTNLWMGGSPAGNTSYIMGGFTAKAYSYAGSYGEGSCMFHNWSGSFHGLSVTNRGSWATFMQNPYVSTDGYCVIVLRHNYYSTPAIDWCQYYTGYPWREIAVTVTSTSANATGVY